ncbi:class III lanthionine synthetase LanKC [Salinispora vitiensis]|uniref:class III lanthionine synthetase LanKC n=1 Tax=Salinispora vitiensis TaxID=999544 RepID=UPI00037AF087|nr:class III lanthionine synthetase LanKC [Salinispora vitiensis]
MRQQPEAYCLADPVFYDSHSRWEAESSAFEETLSSPPDGWYRSERDVWICLNPVGVQLPQQGWKVHVSARPENASQVLRTVHAHCLRNRLPFKFLRSANVHRAHNYKYASRTASGKLVTIYPSDEETLHGVLTDLGKELEGEPGPYILTDLRWGAGPLFVRYGAFVDRYCLDENGETVLALAKPDGTLVPDSRKPVFTVAPWVDTPAFLAPHLAARNAGDPSEFPYLISRVLHFSNAGGVYLARRKSDNVEVVLKEARPHAGIDGAGEDAVTRLVREHTALRQLAGVAGVPAVYDRLALWEHEFLVQEYLPGQSLYSWLAINYPLTMAAPTAEQVSDYTRRALAILTAVAEIIERIHERGLVYGDLHPNNIMISDDDRVSLVDFELVCPAEADVKPAMGYPGFVSRTARGRARDLHALAVLRLWIFLPLASTFELDPGRMAELAPIAMARFDLPAQYAATVAGDLTPSAPASRSLGGPAEVELTGPDPDWLAACRSIAAGILGSATPDRSDRLFPGDIEQFRSGGDTFAYGAAGILWALDRTGHGRFPDHEKWLVTSALKLRQGGAGFCDGLSGIAYVLGNFGHEDEARALLERTRSMVPAMRDVTLFSGLAGLGLTYLHFAAVDEALRIADRLIAALDDPQAQGIDAVAGQARQSAGSRAGLLRGWSGVGLYFLHLHERTGDSRFLDHAVQAVRRDLASCRSHVDGSLQVDGDFRLLPYLEIGSAGIALVAAEIDHRRPDPAMRAAVDALSLACMPEFVIEPQLFNGRAGLLATLRRLSRRHPDNHRLSTAVRRHLERLGWHAITYEGHLAFPGDQGRRLSMDVATGSAGVLLALGAVRDPDLGFLPFLDPPAPLTQPVTSSVERPNQRGEV